LPKGKRKRLPAANDAKLSGSLKRPSGFDSWTDVKKLDGLRRWHSVQRDRFLTLEELKKYNKSFDEDEE
jgi:hypothetical protein